MRKNIFPEEKPLEHSDLPKISAPAQRALASVGVTKLKDITKFTKKQLIELHGMGPNAMSKICVALQEKGLDFA
jgi:hypothetical protein